MTQKAYIEIKNGLALDQEIATAVVGLEYLGYDIETFTLDDLLKESFPIFNKTNKSYKKIAIIGGIKSMSIFLRDRGHYPAPIDYPTDLHEFFGREIHSGFLSDVIRDYKETKQSYFVKPVSTKLFTGAPLSKDMHLPYFKGFEKEAVYYSKPLDIISEHRVFVHQNKMMDCRCYAGNFKVAPNYVTISKMIKAWKKAPISYTIDVATVKNEKSVNTVIIECNDFWAISSYGLDPEIYATMLLDRYFDMVQ